MQKARSQPRTPQVTHQPPTACMQTVSGSISLPAQGCFSPFPHGTRSLSVTRESLALEGGPPSFTPDYSSRALLRNSTTSSTSSWPTGLSPSMAPRSRGLRLTSLDACVGPTTPAPLRTPVWALPLSLATTQGISFDFSSSGYLDVSVPPVRSAFAVTGLTAGWVAPFGDLGIKACVPLPRAYRSLPRPSSPSSAQASSVCIHSLDYNSCQAKHARSTTSVSVLCTRRCTSANTTVRFILPRTLLRHLSKSTSYAAPRGGLPEQL
jgi:hypothetical protein